MKKIAILFSSPVAPSFPDPLPHSQALSLSPSPFLFCLHVKLTRFQFRSGSPYGVCKISLSFRFRISLSDMTNYKSAFGKVCRIKNRQTFKSMPILNSAYHAVKYAELRIGILLKVCRFVIRHITTWYGMPN